MDLRVGVEISHSLDVHHDQLVARALKREVTEGLTDTKRLKDYHVIISWLAFIKKKATPLTCGVRRMLSSLTKPELELYLMYLPSM